MYESDCEVEDVTDGECPVCKEDPVVIGKLSGRRGYVCKDCVDEVISCEYCAERLKSGIYHDLDCVIEDVRDGECPICKKDPVVIGKLSGDKGYVCKNCIEEVIRCGEAHTRTLRSQINSRWRRRFRRKESRLRRFGERLRKQGKTEKEIARKLRWQRRLYYNETNVYSPPPSPPRYHHHWDFYKGTEFAMEENTDYLRPISGVWKDPGPFSTKSSQYKILDLGEN